MPRYGGYVTDEVGVMTQEEETELEALIYDIWEKTNTEIGVLIIPSLE